MATKHFNEKDIYFKDNQGNKHKVHLFKTKSRYNTIEHAVCTAYGVEGRYSWVNRPWQEFDHETALRNMIEKLPKEWQETATKQLIDKTSEEEEAKANAMFNNFKAAHDALSENGKAFFAEHAPIMETEEDVRTITGLMALASLMGM